ncbi:peroxisomal biogenesis factor 6 [Colletotrichum spaethianum]|uniref:Peroxisomal ATPase PEX6 n=1 Tax=Colletotrichum spaethianum TaxID=700344 RepID=A0AA37L9H4_9PEZI|nr:peroxisomal biogenesis factor 6 [Colletotrichum spaethianum]GKT41860.1 peroxisomal biogenesis factor 6 [Colletotrichum spaethianum]
MTTSELAPPSLARRNKRSRRRRQDKPAIAARLILDDHDVRGDVGILSEDLFTDLFPHLRDVPSREDGSEAIRHVAIAPWEPTPSPTETAWTVVPVVKSSALKHSTVQFSPSSLSLQNFATILQQVAPSKLSSNSRSGIEIQILDVVALSLDTVYVSLESELTKRLEQGEGPFTATIQVTSMAKVTPFQKLPKLVLSRPCALRVLHSGDLFPLPLPPHPVTHIPPNPGKIMLCEPVSQGILSETTKIVLMRGRVHAKRGQAAPSIPPNRSLNGVPEDEEEDTANDQFFSAAEDRYKTDAANTEIDSVTETEESELSGVDQDDDLSDDSMDDMISLQAPTLPTTAASGVSTMQPGTPMTVGRGKKTNGIATPASVFSNYTATTARPDRPRGRLFRAQGLVRTIPVDLLHPKPAPEDDDEARVFVDIASLSKIGCFSGDWVRVEAAEEPPANGFGAFGLGSFTSLEPVESSWRPVRVYGLPEGYSQRPVTRIPSAKHGERRLSFFDSQLQKPTSPTAYISPILLANLEEPSYLRLSPIKRGTYQGKGTLPKFTSASRPPYARDITIQHVRSPVTAERAYQSAVLGGLKRYFAQKIRLVRTGDLIAVPIDTQLGKALQEQPSGSNGSEVDDVMALSKEGSARFDQVAWFKVGHIQMSKSDADNDQSEELWGGVACIDSSSVAMHGSGFATHRIPATKSNTWPYYLGVKKMPTKAPSASALTLPDQDQRYISPLRRRLRELLAAATSPRAIHLKMPPVAILVTATHRNIGKATVASEACSDIGLHTYSIDAYDILSEAGTSGSDVKTEGLLRTRAERAMSCGPETTALLIRHIEALTADRMVSTMREVLQDTRVLIATTSDVDKVPDGVRGLFSHELEMGAPDEAEREGILRAIIEDRGINLDPEVDLNGVALKTAALVAGDLVDVVDRALIAQRLRLEQISSKTEATGQAVTVRDLQVAGGPMARCVTKGDFEVAVEAARKNFAGAIGAPKIPNVTWDDVGGLNNVKDAVTETIQLPLERPELFAKGMKKRSGILFYGPPGTGKTLLAKAIATEYSLNFFSVKGPELLNMYIGESEANVRRVFQRARDARPCVVFFDELDSVAPKRGNQGDSGGVMDRIVSQLLAELDGMSGGDDTSGGVFVIGATNRPDLLDAALLRPGRFDKMLYLGVSDTHDKQLTILEALTRKFTLHPSVSLQSVAQRLPFTYTGADFYALCSDAMLKAVTRQAAAVDAKIRDINAARAPSRPPISTAYFFDHHATPDDIAVMVTEEDFMRAHEELVPSVSAGELAHYERVRASFEGSPDKDKQAQLQRPAAGAVRAVSGSSVVSRGSSKGKGKAFAASSKGKGKAVALGSDDDYESEGEVAVTNGKGKGKGKAVAGFQDGTASDDEGLY